jgi:hypothetical protein
MQKAAWPHRSAERCEVDVAMSFPFYHSAHSKLTGPRHLSLAGGSEKRMLHLWANVKRSILWGNRASNSY